MIGLTVVSAILLAAMGLWVLLVNDPLGGRPQASVFIETDTILIDAGLVGVANVRPSMTPDPDDVSTVTLSPPRATVLAEVTAQRQAGVSDAPASQQEDVPVAANPSITNEFVSSSSDLQRLSVFPVDNLVSRSGAGLIPKRLSYDFPGHSAKNEPLHAPSFVACSGGGWIVKRLVRKGPY